MVERIRDLEVKATQVADLRPYAGNPRSHTKKQIRQVAESIRTFGWTNPILIDGDNGVVAGHGRLEAAKFLGLKEVPTIRIVDLTEAQIRAYVIADNRLAELAGWDDALLSSELRAFSELELDFELEVVGFETAEIDLRIASVEEAGAPDEADNLPNIDSALPPISQLGDLWLLGPHRLLCADSSSAEAFACLLEGKKAQMGFLDHPFNVPVDGHVCGLGAVKHQEFAMASGEMSEAEFVEFLRAVLGHMANYSHDGAIHFVCMDWRHIFELISAGRHVYSELKNLCVWNKTNGGMGSLYRSKHELIAVFKAGTAAHINNINLGAHGRYRTNVWDYAGANSFGSSRDSDLRMHPTVKPVAMVQDAILDYSRRGGIILDAFSGSGSTIIAAERAGRRGFGIELSPQYVDVTLQRFLDLYGEDPVNAQSRLTFSELKKVQSESKGDCHE